MNVIRLFSAAALLLVGAVTEAMHAPTSRIDSVTVYRDGATVRRVATVSVNAGPNAVTISGLTKDIEPGALQVEVSTEGVRIGQIQLEVVQRTDAYDAEVRRLTAERERVQLQVSELEDRTKSAQLQLRFLDGLAEGYAKQAWLEGARGSADVSSWQEALTVLGGGADRAHEQIRSNGVARAEAQKELSRLERELATARGNSLASSRVHLTLESERAQTVELVLAYYEGSAWWRPSYEARLDSEAGRLNLVQSAVVAQTSDEPWENVRLTLSSGEPSVDLSPPELASEFLDLRDPGRHFEPVTALQPDAAVEEMVVTGTRVGSATVTPYAVAYDVPGRVSVANQEDDAQMFEVARYQFDVELATRLIPRVSTDAFLTVAFDYAESAPLYAAPMQVYVDGTYMGETEMPTALPGAEVSLPMGLDRRVQVTVRDQGGAKRESGIIGRRKTEGTDYLFEVTNRRTRNTRVEVFDRYPVARNEDIEVAVPRTATTPDETDVDDKPGVVAWRRILEGGESWRIRHQYEVSYPADRSVVSN